MRPALRPGDGVLALRGGAVRRGQLRVFSDPTLPSRWLVKRVANVRGAGRDTTFEACSDNPARARRRRLATVRVGARGWLVPRGVDGPRAPGGAQETISTPGRLRANHRLPHS